MKKFIAAIIVIAAILGVSYKAHAVFVTPQFVVFENNNTARITLNNRSNAPKVITFEWQRRYFDSAQTVQILEDGQAAPAKYMPADPYVKFSPRRIILKPLESQTIRLIVNRSQDMAEGEYRSQFIIKEENLVEQTADASAARGVSGVVTVNVNTGIPVFIRNGQTDVNLTLNSVKTVVEDGKKFLSLNLSNNSTRTLYTDAYVKCGNKTEDTYVGSIRGMVERTAIQELFPLHDKGLQGCTNSTLIIKGVRDRQYGNKVIIEQLFTL